MIFAQLRRDTYPSKGLKTGDDFYDDIVERFLAWDGSLVPYLDSVPRQPLQALSEMPFLEGFGTVEPEALGRAMLINQYTPRVYHDSWNDIDFGLKTRMEQFRKVFTEVAVALDRGLINAEDTAELLCEMPDSLFNDGLELFEFLFLRSFPEGVPDQVRPALDAYLDGFFQLTGNTSASIRTYIEGRPIIDRISTFIALAGRDESELAYYRELWQMRHLSCLHAYQTFKKLGPVHKALLKATDIGHDVSRPYSEEIIALISAMKSPQERGTYFADLCRATQKSAFWLRTEQWRNAGLPFDLRSLAFRNYWLEKLINTEMEFTEEQACVALEGMCRVASKYASNFPTFTPKIARTLARSLPSNRPDLAIMIKETTYETTDYSKQVLLDAVRGDAPRPMRRILTRLLPKRFPFADRAEAWGEWIEEKRDELAQQMSSGSVHGVAAPDGTNIPGWGECRGQLYGVDVIGYAKRVARAQSEGFDVVDMLCGLRTLHQVAKKNLDFAERTKAIELDPTETVRPLSLEEGKSSLILALDSPSNATEPLVNNLGLTMNPTLDLVFETERKVLRALKVLIRRIEHLVEHPDLIPFEYQFRAVLENEHTFPRLKGIKQVRMDAWVRGGLPDGIAQRIEFFDFDLLDSPTPFDTEPAFAEVEFKTHCGLFWSMFAATPAMACALLSDVVHKCFSTYLPPHAADWRFAYAGYRAEQLGYAALTGLLALPNQAGASTLAAIRHRIPQPNIRGRIDEALDRLPKLTTPTQRIEQYYKMKEEGLL